MRGQGRKQIWKKKSTEADADHGKEMSQHQAQEADGNEKRLPGYIGTPPVPSPSYLGDSDSVKRQQISFPEYSWEFVKRSSYGSFMGVSYESYLICIEFLLT